MSRTGTILGVEHQTHLLSHLFAGVEYIGDILHQDLDWMCFREGEVPDQVPQLSRECEEMALLGLMAPFGWGMHMMYCLQNAGKQVRHVVTFFRLVMVSENEEFLHVAKDEMDFTGNSQG